MPDAAPPTDDLHVLAQYCGIAVNYLDGDDQLVQVDDSTLRALLAAFSVDTCSAASIRRELDRLRTAAASRVLPPVLAMTRGVATELVVRLPPEVPARAWIEWEGGGDPRQLDLVVGPADGATGDGGSAAREVELPADLPEGYHLLKVAAGSSTSSCHLVVAPSFLAFPDSVTKNRVWGFAAQLYSVPSARSWGIGDLADLRELLSWSGSRHGADYLLINPINAAAPVPPLEPSPYLPVSRRYFDPQYLHVEDIPEYRALSPADRDRCAQLRSSAAQGLTGAGLIDRDTSWAAKRAALSLLYRAPRSTSRDAAFRAYVDREGEDLLRYATWCGLAERYGAVSSAWPTEFQDAASPAVRQFRETADAVQFHRWLQWQLDCQLADVQSTAKASMQIGVMHDLPVGVHPDGADTWSDPQLFATTVSVGAPPDAFNQLGQNWAQHPWRPDELARSGYAPFRKLVAGILRHSGGLRIDHIIGLFRLWWIPQDRPATQGSYVRYDHEVLLGIAALEARRAGAVVIGEDLGTFEPAMQNFLRQRGIPGTSVLWFEMADGEPLPPERWREWCLASVTTHDLPPAACFVNGDHVRLRHRLGLLGGTLEDELAQEQKTLARWVDRLRRSGCVGQDPGPQQIVEGLYRYLTLTPCRLVNVALSDAAGDLHTQNLPGTTDAYPNWRYQIAGADGTPMFLEDVISSATVARLADAVAGALQQSAERLPDQLRNDVGDPPGASPEMARPVPEGAPLPAGDQAATKVLGKHASAVIRAARDDDLETLREIERAAAQVFREWDMTLVAEDEPPTIAALAEFSRDGRAWVHTDGQDRPIAYCLAEILDGAAHVEQVSVHPDQARRGIGRLLLDRVAQWARQRDLAAITLTTFAEVPWNAPYYRRLGFHVVPVEDIGPGLSQLLRREAEHGLDRWPRVVMRRLN